jgi:Fe-S-cluster containining protein
VIESQCTFLGQEGCSLGDNKPFACEQYPLSFDPKQDRYYFDAECPLYEQYQHDLAIDQKAKQSIFATKL